MIAFAFCACIRPFSYLPSRPLLTFLSFSHSYSLANPLPLCLPHICCFPLIPRPLLKTSRTDLPIFIAMDRNDPDPPSSSVLCFACHFYFLAAVRRKVLLQQGVRLIARLNRRKSRKGTPTRRRVHGGCARREDETERKKDRLLSVFLLRRFQSDTNLYSGKILAFSPKPRSLFCLPRVFVSRETLIVKLECSAALEENFRVESKYSTGVDL